MTQSQAVQAPLDACAGAMLGPYRILECIGDGGMGRVYRAEHVELGRPAAIKFLLPPYAADPEAVSRFLQEAKAVNRVRHANLVDIYDVFGEPERGIRAYVMELLSGRSLRDAMLQGPLNLRTVLSITRQIASALHAVHGEGIVHRDLKPENIYLVPAPDGGSAVKVLDFGVAKFTRGDVPYQTGTGTALGSPWYMAPEQARQQPVDHRADVYSLGVLLYEMLTGRPPFCGYSFALVIQGHLTAEPPPLRRLDGWEPPGKVCAAVRRCLEKDRAARPADMAALWRDLALAAGPALAGPPTLLPPHDPTSGRVFVPEAPRPEEGPIAPTPRRLPVRRLAALSFAFGLCAGLAALAVLERETKPVVVARIEPRPAPRKRLAAAATRPPPPAPAPKVDPPAPPQPASKPAPTTTRPKPTRRAEAKPSRWSKEAFDQKRSRASGTDDADGRRSSRK